MGAEARVRNVTLREDLAQRLDAVLEPSGRSTAAAIEEAIELYVRDREHELALIDEAIASLAEGKAHSAESIFAWMDSWGTADELPPPEPDVDLDGQ